MKDVTYIAAFPKSGITYLNYMLFHILFDAPQDSGRIDSDYIFDVHESLARVPAAGETPRYVKIHSSYGPGIPLRERASRAVYLVRDPIDVMMSAWDFKHLLGEAGLLEASPAEHKTKFEAFCSNWLVTGGMEFPFAGSWIGNVRSWLDQPAIPALVVQYEKLKQDPLAQLQRILKFLDRPASDERIRDAIEAGKVDNMRKRETEEVASRVSGAFYRPALAKGYAQGYRFVGRLHQGSYEKILGPSAKKRADEIFGPVLARIHETSG